MDRLQPLARITRCRRVPGHTSRTWYSGMAGLFDRRSDSPFVIFRNEKRLATATRYRRRRCVGSDINLAVARSYWNATKFAGIG